MVQRRRTGVRREHPAADDRWRLSGTGRSGQTERVDVLRRLVHAGHTAYEQGVQNRAKLFATPYAAYEKMLIGQLTRQFAASGFVAKRDVAGIILNRWGHARLVQAPGWFYGRDGERAPREIVAAGYGRVSIGHSELNGHQSATGAMAQGKRLGEAAGGAG